MSTPYKHRVPRKDQRVMLALYRAYLDDRPMQLRDIAHRAGVRPARVLRVLARLRALGWAERSLRREGYTFTTYGAVLTEEGSWQVIRRMAEKHWKRQHRQVNGCRWDPGRIKIDV